AEAFASDEGMEARFGRTCERVPHDIINFLHDPLACAIALGWDQSVEIRELRVKTAIKDGWLSQTEDRAGKPTRVVTSIDGSQFSEFWLSTVAGKS
ncbi:MAG: hypothetical protein JO099_15835, partial [Acidobacteriia bacterium]|nr:hypothetical protein [Terriglobia bacterium]